MDIEITRKVEKSLPFSLLFQCPRLFARENPFQARPRQLGFVNPARAPRATSWPPVPWESWSQARCMSADRQPRGIVPERSDKEAFAVHRGATANAPSSVRIPILIVFWLPRERTTRRVRHTSRTAWICSPHPWDNAGCNPRICLVVAAFGLYATVLFRRKPRDERESLHLPGSSASWPPW